MTTNEMLEDFRYGAVKIQDLAWDIIETKNRDTIYQKARLINCLCNQFLGKIEKYSKNSFDNKP